MSPLKSTGDELPAIREPLDNILDSIDAPRDYLSGKVINFASDIDRFFGDDRNYLESNQSVVQMELARAIGYGGNQKFALSGRAKLNLPSTEKRLNLLLETNPDRNITGEPTQGSSIFLNRVITPESIAAAMRYVREVSDEMPVRFTADAGIKFQGLHVDPFTRASASYSTSLELWRLKAVESVYWFNTIGAGETAQLDMERLISDPTLFRATSVATWLNDRQNFDLRQDFSLYHTVSERTALLYQLSVTGISHPQSQVTDYVALMLYRYKLHRNWIFFEVSPQLHFPKDQNYRLSPALNMRLEMLLDKSN